MHEEESRKRQHSSDTSFSSACESESPMQKSKQEKKKSKTEETHTQLENMALQEALNEINRKLEKLNELDIIKETMATKQDIKDMREEFERAVQILNNKVEVLEGTVFGLEKNNDVLTNQISALKESNNDLIKKLDQANKRNVQSENELNYLEQYTRNWSLRIFKIQEAKGENEDCIAKAVKIFREEVGADIETSAIETAHRTGGGKREGATRAVIVRFHSREVRDNILKMRRNLKGKPYAIAEDLTRKNVNLLKKAETHSASLTAWSSRGRVLAKLKNGRVVPLDITTDMDREFRRAMGIET